ncbi:MAG: GNAT family N-acetyltransferase, partial [Chloroflexota bacterium]
MTSVTQVSAQQYHENLRRFDFRRDMFAVADLIELCFEDRLDEDGQRLIKQFRSIARERRGFTLGISTPKQFPLTLAGFVWRENSSLIGNLNLVPIRGSGERAYLIANVAVHPDHRRKGIARALTDAAISCLTEKQVAWCWLQVDDDNQSAINLYEQSGFSEQARTTTWQCDPPTA